MEPKETAYKQVLMNLRVIMGQLMTRSTSRMY